MAAAEGAIPSSRIRARAWAAACSGVGGVFGGVCLRGAGHHQHILPPGLVVPVAATASARVVFQISSWSLVSSRQRVMLRSPAKGGGQLVQGGAKPVGGAS